MNYNVLIAELKTYKTAYRDLEIAKRYAAELGEASLVTGSLTLSSDRIVSSGTTSARFEDLIIDKADLERIITEEEDCNLKTAKKHVLSLIDLLPDKTDRLLLIMRYIDCFSWDAIANILGYSESHVFNRHRSICKNLLTIINSQNQKDNSP